MRRGEIWLVDFEPSRGSEANKLRPAVVVSNDGANMAVARSGMGVITVAPITSNTTRVYEFQVFLEAGSCGLPRDGKVQAEQLRAVAAERLHSVVGSVPAATMAEVDEALRLHLAV